MARVPVHSGSRLPLLTLPDDAALLAAPPPLDPIVDVQAAVAEALRYPLSGPLLRGVAPSGGRATVVVQPPPCRCRRPRTTRAGMPSPPCSTNWRAPASRAGA